MPATRSASDMFSSLPLPLDERPAMKYKLKAPLTQTYIPSRSPSPEPDATLVPPPPIPAELSTCGFVVFGYRVDDTFASDAGFPNRYLAVLEISMCIEELGIGPFLSMPGIPYGQELDVFSFAHHRAGGPIWSVGGRGGIPAERLRELEERMGIKRPAEWINFDEIDSVINGGSNTVSKESKYKLVLVSMYSTSYKIRVVSFNSCTHHVSAKLPYEERPVFKYKLKPQPAPKPSTSTFVPKRMPSPDPNEKLVQPPPIPAELSNCHFVVYGYLINDTFALDAGFPNRIEALFKIAECIEWQLRIGAFLLMPSIPRGQELDILSFAEHRNGSIIWSPDKRGIPAEKLKELEVRMNIKRPAEWINYDEINRWWE